MILSIGKVIYKIRKSKGFTQEHLANVLGVSTSAVSKWESGTTYPDITLLSPTEVMDINKKCSEAFETCDFDFAMKLFDSYIKEYPTNLYLKFRLGSMLQSYLHLAGTEDKCLVTIKKAISLLKASSESDDFEIKQGSIFVLSGLYAMNEEFDKAESLLKTLTKSIMNPDMMLASIYYMQGKIDESKKTHQQCLYTDINNSLLSILSLSKMALKDDDFKYALELASIHRKIIELYSLEAYMMNMNSMLYLDIYSKMKNEDLSLYYLEEFAEFSLHLKLQKFKLSDIKIFSLLKTTDPIMSLDFLKQTSLLSITMNDDYNFLKDSDRYKKVIAKFS